MTEYLSEPREGTFLGLRHYKWGFHPIRPFEAKGKAPVGLTKNYLTECLLMWYNIRRKRGARIGH